MQPKLRPIDVFKPAIRDWQLVEDESARYPSLRIPGILTLVSEVDIEECKKLLRAVVNLYLNAKLQRQGVVQHWQRERKLHINYVRKEEWEWRIELLDVARAYFHYENRPEYKAQIEISGSIVRFESKISSSYRRI